jgi:drug/metabolite transporter (DMT)-like permease
MGATAQTRPPRPRSTVFGLDAWQACFLPVVVSAAVRLVTDGVHDAWDWFVVVTVVGYVAATIAAVLLGRRQQQAPRDAQPTRQDWLLTLLLVALTALFLLPDDTPDGAPWPWALLAAVLVSGLALGLREWRRR